MTRSLTVRTALLALALTAVGAQAAKLPVVQLPTIEQGTMVRGQQLLDILWNPADDGTPVTSVELYIDNQRVAAFDVRADQRNIVFPWDTAAMRDGQRSLLVRIEDAKGRKAEYQSHVFVRNLGQPQPTRGDTWIEVIDLDSQPDTIITQRAIVRVHVDARIGSKYVMIYLNDRFIAFGNQANYELKYDPAARGDRDGAYQVRARVVLPDGSESYPPPVDIAVNVGGTYTGLQPGMAAAAPAAGGSTLTDIGTVRPSDVVRPPQLPGSLAEAAGRPAGSTGDAGPGATAGRAVPSPGGSAVAAPGAQTGHAPAQLPTHETSPGDVPRTLGPTPSPGAPTEPGTGVAPAASGGTTVAPAAAGTATGNVTVGSAAPATGATAPATAGTTRPPTQVTPPPLVRLPGEPAPSRPSAPERATPPTVAPRPTAPTAPATVPRAGSRRYTVQHGDTLFAIARRCQVSVRDLARLNNLRDPGLIHTGDTLLVPGPRGALVVNGQTVLTDVPPLEMRQGVPMTAIRYVVEALGGKVEWDSPLKSVTATTVDRGVIRITIGSTEAQVNDERVLMDLAAYLHGGRAMVPTRFVRDALDVSVELSASSGDITIRSNR